MSSRQKFGFFYIFHLQINIMSTLIPVYLTVLDVTRDWEKISNVWAQRKQKKQQNQPCWKTISRKFKYCLSPFCNDFYDLSILSTQSGWRIISLVKLGTIFFWRKMLRGEHLRLQEYDRKTEEKSDLYLGFHSVLPAVRFCYPALSDLQVCMTGIGLSRSSLGAEKVRRDFHITERTLEWL